MPYAFQNIDERVNFLYACLKSAIENGGKVNIASVSEILHLSPKKVAALLSLAKKAGDALVKNATKDAGLVSSTQSKGALVESSSEDIAPENSGKSAKRKALDSNKTGGKQIQKSKKAKMAGELKRSKGVVKDGGSGGPEAA